VILLLSGIVTCRWRSPARGANQGLSVPGRCM
jgi:hypothetical protein